MQVVIDEKSFVIARLGLGVVDLDEHGSQGVVGRSELFWHNGRELPFLECLLYGWGPLDLLLRACASS